jgi:hypothetical protein
MSVNVSDLRPGDMYEWHSFLHDKKILELVISVEVHASKYVTLTLINELKLEHLRYLPENEIWRNVTLIRVYEK